MWRIRHTRKLSVKLQDDSSWESWGMLEPDVQCQTVKALIKASRSLKYLTTLVCISS